MCKKLYIFSELYGIIYSKNIPQIDIKIKKRMENVWIKAV